MRTFTFRRRQNGARWLLIYGVLVGLLFSSGEGIQLMPFPVSTGSKVSRLTASSREENSKSYAFTVFNSRNSFALLKAKFQKDPDQSLPGERFTPERLETRADLSLRADENLRQAVFRRRFAVPNSKSKRAPPVT